MVLVARLAGPLQSWGAEPRLKTATTTPTPTWSGVRGLLRAALGHSRDADPDDVAWLDDLTVAVRVDRPGTILVDYQTINPLPESYEQFEGISGNERGIVPLGTTLLKSGQAPRWLIGAKPRPAVTTRHYLQDAAFLLLIEGPGYRLDTLCDALTEPHWALQLGRKSCTPAAPILLGQYPGNIVTVALAAPTMTCKQVASLDLVWLYGTPDPTLPVRITRTVLDQPLGAHPQHGYTANQHTVTRLTMAQPSATNDSAEQSTDLGTDLDPSDIATVPPTTVPYGHDALINWARTHLVHPGRPQESLT